MKIKSNIAISFNGYVFDPSSGESYTLNDIGKEIVEQLKEEKSKEEISSWFLSRYEVDEYTFERYYVDFVNTLSQYNLIET